MGYNIHIRRHNTGVPDSPIALSDWRVAVECTDGVRMAEEDYQIANPKTGELIRIRNRGGDAEILFPDEGAWRRVFWWFEGRISFGAPRDFELPTCFIRRAATDLARALGARLIGDDGEIYD